MNALQPDEDRSSTISRDAAMDRIAAVETALFIRNVWFSDDGSWHGGFKDSRPIVVDETDACRLERIWPAGPEHLLTVNIQAMYVHVLFGRRPRTSDTWAFIALLELRMQVALGTAPSACLVH